MSHGRAASARSDTHIGRPVPVAMTTSATIAANTRLVVDRVQFTVRHVVVVVMLAQMIREPVQNLDGTKV